MLYPDIDPVLLELGPLKLRWYGLMYLVGFAGAWLLARYRARQPGSGWTPPQVDDLLFYCALGVVLGGRIGYILFYGFQDWVDDPLRLFRVWEGGMSFHGGFLGVLAAVALYQRRHGRRFFELTDFVAPMVPLGLFAGRLGNFINGELWGGPAAGALPWAMQVRCADFYNVCFDKLQLPAGTVLSPPLHPSQLYEAALEGLVLFAILWVFSNKTRPRMAVSALFLIFYGLFRFSVEFVRMPDAHIGYLAFDWLTMGQVLSAPMILIGLLMLMFAYRRPS
jgi:phosphatidylglycerol:prolipoprotein diacylglycerol transferase